MFSSLYPGTNNPAEILSEVDLKHKSQLDERTTRHFLATKALSLDMYIYTNVISIHHTFSANLLRRS